MSVSPEKIRQLIKRIGTDGYRDGSSTQPGAVYHTIPFEGFEDVHTHKVDQCSKEYDLIRGVLTERGIEPTSLLDIGCNIGYFTFSFNRDYNMQVAGVEKDTFNADVVEAFIEHFDLSQSIDLFKGDVADYLNSTDRTFDMALMLNVHMWVHKQHGTEGTKNIMRTLCSKVKHLFFQTAHAQSSGMYLIKELGTVGDVHRYLEECGFTGIKKVYETDWHGKKNRTLFYAQGTA